jgi:rhodanese-related sulfurtransferase
VHAAPPDGYDNIVGYLDGGIGSWQEMGYRGNIAASFLQGEGFQYVHSLASGMQAWVNVGYPEVT